jgi:hypothetical protein
VQAVLVEVLQVPQVVVAVLAEVLQAVEDLDHLVEAEGGLYEKILIRYDKSVVDFIGNVYRMGSS